jgi:hypothetical protein
MPCLHNEAVTPSRSTLPSVLLLLLLLLLRSLLLQALLASAQA